METIATGTPIAKMPQIDFGRYGWDHPGMPGYTFGSEVSANQHASAEGKAGKASFVDTRPTLREVRDQLAALENAACGLSGEQARYRVGPWEENFSLQSFSGRELLEPKSKWPHGYHFLSVYVVTGGSEGLWLHVDVILMDGTRQNLLLGKTLDCSQWEACWMSASRIAHFLQA